MATIHKSLALHAILYQIVPQTKFHVLCICPGKLSCILAKRFPVESFVIVVLSWKEHVNTWLYVVHTNSKYRKSQCVKFSSNNCSEFWGTGTIEKKSSNKNNSSKTFFTLLETINAVVTYACPTALLYRWDWDK